MLRLRSGIGKKTDELDIHLFFLPSNTTKKFQPMNKCIFHAFEHHSEDKPFAGTNIVKQNKLVTISKSCYSFNSIVLQQFLKGPKILHQ